MPELVASGPIIPVQLMNDLDNERVVFFCGAGVSAGPGSGLPGFKELVEHVYSANLMEPDSVEQAALDLPTERQPQFDKALGLLERPDRLGAELLRATVIDCLSKPSFGPLDVHEALITLSRRERGVCLVTTNFDNRFADAGLEKEFIDAAPKLPVPKPNDWSSLVHLHGRIMPNEDGSSLVLTAADFGRAYLIDQWAARFITELFREFTVVFVGYSVGDPVMGYMVDALAGERAKGVRFATAFAFAGHDGTSDGKQKERDGWLAKNVEPILYSNRNRHELLHSTLIEWARIRSDPFKARSQIAVNEITKLPSGPDDPAVERVVWALQDPVAAKALADEPPVKDEEDFAKVGKWLELLTESGLLRNTAVDANASGDGEGPVFIHLVDSGLQVFSLNTKEMTRLHFARWLASHMHVPQTLAWVLHMGGHMHHTLRQEIRRRLSDRELRIPSRMRLLWTVLADQEPHDFRKTLWTLEQYRTAKSGIERRCIEDEVIRCFAPRLFVRPGPGSDIVFRQHVGWNVAKVPPIDACGHLVLISGEEDTWHQVKELFEEPGVLARHAETLSGHLEQALALGAVSDEIYEESYLHRPSIAEHDQNRDHDNWTRLIDLVRDGYFALAGVDRGRAENLLGRWVLSRRSLFKRLALHALTENPKADIQIARKLLVAGRKPGIWEIDLRREVLRFLRKAGRRLPRGLRVEIVRAIHTGPRNKRKMSQEDYTRLIRREKALRFHRLAESGARLDKRSKALADEITDAGRGDRDEFAAWHGEGRWVSIAEFAPKALLEGSVADAVDLFEIEEYGQDEYRGFMSVQPVKAAAMLRRVAMSGKWPAPTWEGFLWGLGVLRDKPVLKCRMQDYVARILADAPDTLFMDVGTAAAGFVKDLAEDWEIGREREYEALWNKAWGGIRGNGSKVNGIDDPLTDALNHAAGKLAEAALTRLWKYEPKAGAGLPAAVRPYFDAIGSDPDGHLGRVMLATNLHQLFAIEPDWACDHLIARLDTSCSEEAVPLWSAYSWSQSVGPDLLQAFKEPFLEILSSNRDLGRGKSRLIRLFITICLESPNELGTEEIGRVIRAMSEDALTTALVSLSNRLRGSEDERAQIWRERIDPWLQKYWPRQANKNTANTSSAILQLLVECGDAFSDAAAWSIPYLRPMEGHGLFRFGRSPLAGKQPDAVLDVLDEVCVDNVLPVHQKHTLCESLDALKKAKPALSGDHRFQRLYKLATR